jgi:hypothetical protein
MVRIGPALGRHPDRSGACVVIFPHFLQRLYLFIQNPDHLIYKIGLPFLPSGRAMLTIPRQEITHAG